jgi:hypothetical protein
LVVAIEQVAPPAQVKAVWVPPEQVFGPQATPQQMPSGAQMPLAHWLPMVQPLWPVASLQTAPVPEPTQVWLASQAGDVPQSQVVPPAQTSVCVPAVQSVHALPQRVSIVQALQAAPPAQ